MRISIFLFFIISLTARNFLFLPKKEKPCMLISIQSAAQPGLFLYYRYVVPYHIGMKEQIQLFVFESKQPNDIRIFDGLHAADKRYKKISHLFLDEKRLYL